MYVTADPASPKGYGRTGDAEFHRCSFESINLLFCCHSVATIPLPAAGNNNGGGTFLPASPGGGSPTYSSFNGGRVFQPAMSFLNGGRTFQSALAFFNGGRTFQSALAFFNGGRTFQSAISFINGARAFLPASCLDWRVGKPALRSSASASQIWSIKGDRNRSLSG